MPIGLGIDIGAHSFKLVQVRTQGSHVEVLKAVKLDHNLAARPSEGGLDLPPALASEIQRAGLSRTGVLGISGRDLILRYAIVPPAAPWRLKEIMRYEVEQGPTADAGEMCSDYRILSMSGGGMSDQFITLLAVAKADHVASLMERLQAVKVNVRHCVPASVALFNAYRASAQFDASETVFLLDVGHDKAEMAIVARGDLIFARSVPGGGRKFTDAIDKVFRAGKEKSAAFKHQRAAIPADGAGDKQSAAMFGALRPVAEQLVNAVNNGLRFCQTQTKIKDVAYGRVLISGGGARLKGLLEYMAKRLGKPVEALDLSAGVAGRGMDPQSQEAFGAGPTEMAVAVGLAVCAADPDAFSLELVPPAVERRRAFLSKTIYAYAAALVLLVLMVVQYRGSTAALASATAEADLLENALEKAEGKRGEYEQILVTVEDLRRHVDLFRRQRQLGSGLIELLHALRAAKPKGVHLTSIAPYSKDRHTFDDAFLLSVRGQVDLKEVPDWFPTVRAFADELKKHPFVLEVEDLTGDVKPNTPLLGGKKKTVSEFVQPFAFNVRLDPGEPPEAADGQGAGP